MRDSYAWYCGEKYAPTLRMDGKIVSSCRKLRHSRISPCSPSLFPLTPWYIRFHGVCHSTSHRFSFFSRTHFDFLVFSYASFFFSPLWASMSGQTSRTGGKASALNVFQAFTPQPHRCNIPAIIVLISQPLYNPPLPPSMGKASQRQAGEGAKTWG